MKALDNEWYDIVSDATGIDANELRGMMAAWYANNTNQKMIEKILIEMAVDNGRELYFVDQDRN